LVISKVNFNQFRAYFLIKNGQKFLIEIGVITSYQMTKKGEWIQDQIIHYLERNPDGLRVGKLKRLLDVSRNSIYRYLEELQMRGLIKKCEDNYWQLKEPIKPQTIFGFQYQAVLQGLKAIGGEEWSIDTVEGKNNFKELGRFLLPHMKLPDIDVDALKQQTHKMDDIITYLFNLVQEAITVENFTFHPKWNENGFPNPRTHLAALIEFSGGYVSSDPVVGNGFAHYYILAGMIEEAARQLIPKIYGGSVEVNVIKEDVERQLVDIGFYVIFDEKTPYIDPQTKKEIIF
jgi:DNA-binding HxlR family transcriptional regulator